MNFENAVYHDVFLEDFTGNPLVECLPPEVSPEDYPGCLLVTPPYSEESRNASPQARLQYLQRIAQVHIPTKEDSMIMLSLRRCLSWGYAGRNPMGFAVVARALGEKGVGMTPGLERYLKSFNAPIYGFPVLGVSGVGKTTSIDNVLSLYSQVIHHTEYRGIPFNALQLVWLKVECPGDGTPKGLCTAILHGIDHALGSDYTQQIVRNRMSKDVLLIKVSQLVQSLHLGILLIDDIQNICSAKDQVSEELLSFMVSMANNLKIPVVMIGTPKILKLLQKEFQQAKRATGEGEVRMNLMKENSTEWNRFLSAIWHYQYTARTVRLTPAMNKAFLASTLYKIVQDDAIISNRETFSAKDVHRVADEKLGMTAQKRRAMLSGEDVELEMYYHLWHAADYMDAAKPRHTVRKESSMSGDAVLLQELAGKIAERLSVTMQEARKYARQAIASHPTETDTECLLGFAISLVSPDSENKPAEKDPAANQNASLSQKDKESDY